MKDKVFILVAICSALIATGCVSNQVRSYSDSTWDIKVQNAGCRLAGVLVTNKSNSTQNFVPDLYVKNKNIPNRTFGHYSVLDCRKIAPNETRNCEFYSSSSKVSASNLGGLGCPDINYEWRY